MRVVHFVTSSLAAGVVLVAVLATVAQTPSSVPQAAPSPATTSAVIPSGRDGEVLNFSLIDYNGRNHELRRAGGRAVVLYFTGVGCPIARQSAHKLQALADRFGRHGVTVWLINATPQNDPDPLALDLMFKLGGRAPREMLGDRYPLKGMRGLVDPAVLGDVETIRKETLETLFGPAPLPPILRDRHQLVSRYFGVTRMCEAIVIDTKR